MVPHYVRVPCYVKPWIISLFLGSLFLGVAIIDLVVTLYLDPELQWEQNWLIRSSFPFALNVTIALNLFVACALFSVHQFTAARARKVPPGLPAWSFFSVLYWGERRGWTWAATLRTGAGFWWMIGQLLPYWFISGRIMTILGNILAWQSLEFMVIWHTVATTYWAGIAKTGLAFLVGGVVWFGIQFYRYRTHLESTA